MMSLETQNSAGGRSAAITRAISPKITTARPDSHTKRSTAGTLRSAVKRSRHPRQNSGFSLMTEQHGHVCLPMMFALKKFAQLEVMQPRCQAKWRIRPGSRLYSKADETS